jgi:hypothetical protein
MRDGEQSNALKSALLAYEQFLFCFFCQENMLPTHTHILACLLLASCVRLHALPCLLASLFCTHTPPCPPHIAFVVLRHAS